MNHRDILRAFGFDSSVDGELESIYPYAPVYCVRNLEGEWIVKRSQTPLSRARAVAAWARRLAAEGIPVVTPAPGFGDNPRAFGPGDDSDEVWVVYPFVPGAPYVGDLSQIESAGDLLGLLHAAGAQDDEGLKRQEKVVAIEAVELERDLEGIVGHVRRVAPGLAAPARAMLAGRVQTYLEVALPRTLEAELPLATCTWDFKASNLIYVGVSAPVLVDPDNAACIPRLYDLAIAALLFHNEGRGPARLLARPEWEMFLRGYNRHVPLTDLERQAWGDVFLCAWIDEGLWLLRNDERGWARSYQAEMLLSLLFADLSIYSLAA